MIKNLILTLSILGLMGCTQSESMELQGRVSMKGASAHTYLSIYDKKRQRSYKIQNNKAFNLEKRQNQTVKLEARIVKEAMGPGFPAVVEVVEVY